MHKAQGKITPQLPINSKSSRANCIIILTIITIIVFGQVINFDFVLWDDDFHIFNNPGLNPATAKNISEYWKKPYNFALTYTAWSIISMISKSKQQHPLWNTFNPQAFHLINLIFHIFNVLLIFLIINSIIKNKWASFGGAILFGLHPIQAEAVAWISSLRDVLSAFFSLLSIYGYICYLKSTAGNKIKYYIFSILAYVLALTSKPTAVMLPFLLLIIDYFLFSKKIKQSIKPVIIWFIVALPFIILAKKMHPGEAIGFNTPLVKRPLIIADTIAFYIYKIILPFLLGPHYGRIPRFVLKQDWIYYIWIFPAIIIILIWKYRKKYAWLLLSFVLFLACILPVLGILNFRFQNYSTVADRYLYLSMIGPAFLLSNLILLIRKKKKYLIIIGLYLLLLGVLCKIQVSHWKNTSTLFEHAIKVNPRSWVAYNKIGGFLAKRKKFDLAIKNFLKATEIWPGYYNAFHNLGLALLLKNNPREAMYYLEKAAQIKPKNKDTIFALANAYSLQNNLTKALDCYNRAIELDPLDHISYNEIGVIFGKTGKYSQAETYFIKAIDINPAYFEAYYNWGIISFKIKDYKKASEYFLKVLELNPDYSINCYLCNQIKR